MHYPWGSAQCEQVLTSNGCFNVKGTEQRHGVVLFQLKFLAQWWHGLELSIPV